MNRMRVVTALLSVSVALLAACTLVSAKPGAAVDPATARGRYLVTLMACNDCHTPGAFYGASDPDRFLAGSEMGWVGPWGVVYAANLTPDVATGLGKWTSEQIAMAIRAGNRPDGRQLASAMPWLNYSALTDTDALAIAVYLKTLKAVTHVVPKPLEPGVEVKGPALAFPPPSAWDAPRSAPPAVVK